MTTLEKQLGEALDRMVTVFELAHEEMLNFELEAIAEAKQALAEYDRQNQPVQRY
jgi:hypothetical protein